MVARTAQLSAGDTGMGRALQGIGAELGQLAERERKANDSRQVLEFEKEMRASQERQQILQQQNQNQDAWVPAWQDEETALKQKLGSLKLSPDVRSALDESLSKYSDGTRMSIREQAVNHAEKRAWDTYENTVLTARTLQDVEDADRLARAANIASPERLDLAKAKAIKSVQGRLYNEFQVERERLASADIRTQNSLFVLEQKLEEVKASMRPELYQLEKDSIAQMKEVAFVDDQIREAPEKVLQQLGSPDYAPSIQAPQQREKLRNKAISRIEQMQADEQRSVMNGILSGSVENFQQAEALMPRSDAIAKAKIQGVFDKKPPSKYEASILKRALEKAVEEFDPTNDPDDAKTFQIVDTINRLNLYDEKLTSTLRERFYKKQQNRTPPSPIESEIANHKKFLDYVYEPKLKALMDPKTGEVPVDKQEEFRSMLSVRDQLASDFERMVESGEIKTREQARNASFRMLAEPYANEVMDYFRYAPSSGGKSGKLELTPEEIQQIEKQRLKK
jgi:hypothetical protein